MKVTFGVVFNAPSATQCVTCDALARSEISRLPCGWASSFREETFVFRRQAKENVENVTQHFLVFFDKGNGVFLCNAGPVGFVNVSLRDPYGAS